MQIIFLNKYSKDAKMKHMKMFKEGLLGLVHLEDIAQAIFRQEALPANPQSSF